MLVYNYRSGEKVESHVTVKGIVKVNDDCLEFGHFTPDSRDILVKTEHGDFPILNKSILDYCYFDGRIGYYVLTLPYRKGKKDTNLKMGRGRFPYYFPQKYEAIHSFDIFKDSQSLINDEKIFKYHEHLPYTFGLEFETSSGYIPQDICLRDGLIPLRDGSITGVEYSTIVLKGNNGLNFLKQQINTLDKYTVFDKECSLHMHIGLPLVTPNIVWNLYVLLIMFQNELCNYVPEWTFESNRYKATRKNYCSKLPVSDNFSSLYNFIAGQDFEGDLTIPHRLDPERTHKWHVHSRYFAFNFVNLMCYKGPKTIEFRFLRPTYNYAEIETWLFVFMGLIKSALSSAKEHRVLDFKSTFEYFQSKYGKNSILFNVFKDVYPEKLAKGLIYRMKIINNIHSHFRAISDFAGLNIEIKTPYFSNSKFNDDL
jgi:hypothetical protein